MPWHEKAKKDAITGETLRRGGNNLWSAGIRMGQPVTSNVVTSAAEYIGCRKPTRGTETSKYPEEEKVKTIFWVVASERERAKTNQHL